ncbi:MAG: Crp/Fnr family transcriptional regulator [Sphingomonas sp.]
MKDVWTQDLNGGAGSVEPLYLALVERLGVRIPLAAADHAKIAPLHIRQEDIPQGGNAVVEGDRVQYCCLLQRGFAARLKTTLQGGRQIVSLHMPGDFIDLQHLLIDIADHSIEAITPIRVLRIPKPALYALASDSPTVGLALWHETLVEASRFREWIANIGRRDGLARVAHLLCEFAVRWAANEGEEAPIRFPMTQLQIADATGLTPVHVNRVLRRLFDAGAIGARRPAIMITDVALLAQIAGFDATYLHLNDTVDAMPPSRRINMA